MCWEKVLSEFRNLFFNVQVLVSKDMEKEDEALLEEYLKVDRISNTAKYSHCPGGPQTGGFEPR